MRIPGITIIDKYIIRKFLGTFFFSIILILAIAVIFDFSEKIDDFIENKAPLREVIFDYYLNFIPYFAVLFSSLFTFIAVIYFTSKMAYNTEIIAILGNGMSFLRLLKPYMIAGTFIALFSFLFTNFVIPGANKVKLDFEEKYIHSRPYRISEKNIHRQIRPGIFIYMENYSSMSDVGHKFSIEKFEDGKLVSKLMADYIKWNSQKEVWTVRNYYIRDIRGMEEDIIRGSSIDTALALHPSDFKRRTNYVETMKMGELNEFIEQQKLQGESNITNYLIEKYRRFSFPFSTFILTLIGVSVSSRKVKGGIGVQIGAGLLIAFSYILFMQFSSQFAIGGILNPLLAVWLPNILFLIVAIFMVRAAPN